MKTQVIDWVKISVLCISDKGFPGGLVGKESTCNAEGTGDMGLIPEQETSPAGEQGNPLQYSCLRNPMDRGAWRATVHRVAESDTTKATEHE